MNNRNNISKVLAETTWGQQKETLTITYKAISRSITDYGALIWAPNNKKTGFDKRQISQDTALRIATGCHKMTATSHLYQETNELPITDQAELLAAQYLTKCMNDDHPCHNITRRPTLPRAMKETLLCKYGNSVQQQQQQQSTNKQVTKALSTQLSWLEPSAIYGPMSSVANFHHQLTSQKNN